jgi:hypothetical protein
MSPPACQSPTMPAFSWRLDDRPEINDFRHWPQFPPAASSMRRAARGRLYEQIRVLLDAISNTSITNIGVSTKAGQLQVGGDRRWTGALRGIILRKQKQ